MLLANLPFVALKYLRHMGYNMLEELQKKASIAYYDGEPIITDEEYDSLFGKEGPIGTGSKGDIPHMWPMWSLQNYFIGEGEPPISGEMVTSPKLDGAAISLLYIDGILVRALTRGDGNLGKNILPNMWHLVPRVLPTPHSPEGPIQVIGEVVAKKTITNARNVAAGALGLKDAEEFISRKQEAGLAFFSYGFDAGELEFDTYDEGLRFVSSLGFNTVLDSNIDSYPNDGRVYRIRSNRLYAGFGYTAQFPKGAYAEKTRETPVVTKLLDVKWQTGKSGKVTPVAILEPIVINDATISRATLNNFAYIDALGLEIGCMVKVIRAGSVIPCVVGRA